MTWEIRDGDCIEAMRAMPEASVDAICTDPPYYLAFMGKAWDTVSPGESQRQHHMWATEALRVLKPGGHLLAFGGTRTYHRLVCAIEDADFEIRDSIVWLYGSGFPKSLDVGKAIDKAAGADREVVGKRQFADGTFARDGAVMGQHGTYNGAAGSPVVTAPATHEAERWEGWGTALKPAHEPIVVARKPLTGTVAANVLEHGTGALNVDGCRVEGAPRATHANGHRSTGSGDGFGLAAYEAAMPAGRWPANVVLDPEAAALLDAQTGEVGGGTGISTRGGGGSGEWNPTDRADGRGQTIRGGGETVGYGDTGGASRFFYVAKAGSAERNAGLDGFEAVEREGQSAWAGLCNVCGSRMMLNGKPTCGHDDFEWVTGKPTRNVHPTVKPIALMRWLVRLVTPPGGRVLDPFAGSGTTGIAAVLEGFEFVGVEREAEYAAIARARIAWWASHPDGMLLVDRLAAEQARRDVEDAGQLSIEGWAM